MPPGSSLPPHMRPTSAPASGPSAHDLLELQAVFQYAAETLPQRVLQGRRLEWRSGSIKEVTQVLKASKRAAQEEIRAFQAREASGGTGGGWTPARPTDPARRSGPVLGGHRQQATNPLLSDLKTGAMKGGVPADAVALLNEGAAAGLELGLTDASEMTPTFQPGYQPDPHPLHEEAIGAMADVVKRSGVLDPAVLGDASEIAAEVAGALPLIGALTNLGLGAVNGIKGINQWMNAHAARSKQDILTPGHPRESLLAVSRLFERRRTEYLALGSLDATAGAIQTAGAFADLGAATGPAAGVAKTLAKLTLKVAWVLRDVAEFRRGNKRILHGPHDHKLVRVCPLIGCYLITEAETSTLMAFLSAGRLPPTWMDDVERLKPEIDTVIRLANQVQRAAPYKLKGYVKAGGAMAGAELKGAHHLDFRARKQMAHLTHEATMIAKRDPRGLKFLGKSLRAKLGL